MIKFNKILIYFALGTLPTFGFAQSSTNNPPANWYNLDLKQDGIMGISTEKAYELLKGRKSQPVIVAVLDGGVDSNHEDLKEVMWTNPKEIPGDGIDNDGNGYIDDIHGWNFLGNANGENVNHDNLEVTRLIRLYEPKYMSVLPSTPLTVQERREFVAYQKMVNDYTSKLDQANFGNIHYTRLKKEITEIVRLIGKDPKDISKTDLDLIKDPTDQQKMAIRIAKKELDDATFEKFFENVNEGEEYFSAQYNYHLNKEYDPRHIIGDNYDDASERHYGNADVKGPDADHGTHVAGIIAAKRNNNLGINGVADQVQIMAVRVVPNGDERDKDVANAIRYAVENGAKIINMSFGKGFVYNKKTVDDAIKFAEVHDVLLVHAAGNDAKDIDVEKNYPTKYFTDSLQEVTGEAKNYLTVGATSWKQGPDLLANFSNYGYKGVDVFAPGVKINSTMPDSKYKEQDGTSMAAPVVSGIAAVLRSYYPTLTAPQVKEIISKSVVKVDQKVKVKSETGNKKAYLDEISVAGGVANLYNAVVEANRVLGTK